MISFGSRITISLSPNLQKRRLYAIVCGSRIQHVRHMRIIFILNRLEFYFYAFKNKENKGY